MKPVSTGDLSQIGGDRNGLDVAARLVVLLEEPDAVVVSEGVGRSQSADA